ncbi:carbohydrate ABC transporter permease [Noviherbaspirillum aerium]|uniref:carbohydrate ABC transporter permease n=1 Tax=Noviherbaspirillum aerium TaxID=2588497 RepID=UPI00124D83DB|nr:sugar ABC transporter permease [Noviherbaspirillum aerium]
MSDPPDSGTPSRSGAGYLMLAPFLFVFLLFFLIPALQTFYISLTESSLTRTSAFVGTANYAALLQDPAFLDSLRHTLYFAALTVVPLATLGLLMALLVERAGRASGLLQAAFFLPYVLPISVMTLIAGWILHPTLGLVNRLAGGERAWLADLDWAMPAVAIGTIWWTVGFNMLLFVAALRNIPRELYEAAALDGAGGFHAFRDITWPELRPTFAMAMILQLIASFKIFGQTYILTAGGPFNTTRVTLHYMYETAFVQSDAGYAAAIAIAFVVIVAVLSLLQAGFIRWLGRRG